MEPRPAPFRGTDTLPETFFASPERASDMELRSAIRATTDSPVVGALVQSFGSLVAVLDRHRQIVAVNDGLLRFLDRPDAAGLLGLRPGEAFRCVHAQDHPAGCGTSKFCRTCGAAISIVIAQRKAEPAEKECLLTIANEFEESLELRVRAAPLAIDGRNFVLLLLQDIRDEKRRQAMERTFCHDLKNTLTGIVSGADLLSFSDPKETSRLIKKLVYMAHLAASEVNCYQMLAEAESGEYALDLQVVQAQEVLADLQEFFSGHPASVGRGLLMEPSAGDLSTESDKRLLFRVLVNMVRNAMEATSPGGNVKVWCTGTKHSITFRVWNDTVMPEEVCMRVFQRYFSTKREAGRGLGTYSMKLLGERYLHGRVGFSSDAVQGTIFYLSVPKKWTPAKNSMKHVVVSRQNGHA